jgi:hypothetical protein
VHDEWFANAPIDDLFLGSDSIDAGLPATPTIAATADDSKFLNHASKSDGSHVTTTYASAADDIVGGNFADQKFENEEDEFAELDAWFASGSVEIL